MSERKPNKKVTRWFLYGVGAFIVYGILLIIFPQLPPRSLNLAKEAIDNMYRIGLSQAEFREKDRDGDGVLEFASSLKELRSVYPKVIDGTLATGKKLGYSFKISLAPGTTDFQFTWQGQGTPSDGDGRHFFIDESVVCRFNSEGPATISGNSTGAGAPFLHKGQLIWYPFSKGDELHEFCRSCTTWYKPCDGKGSCMSCSAN